MTSPGFGVVTVAHGERARELAETMITSLRVYHRDWPVLVIGDRKLPGAGWVPCITPQGYGARACKMAVYHLAPWPTFLYLDADMRIRAPLDAPLGILADGWDLCITASRNQETLWLWQAESAEWQETATLVGRALSLQGGSFYVRKNNRTARFFAKWAEEWDRYRHIDQGALLRALYSSPVRLWLLGVDYNDGARVKHLFGRCLQ